MLNSSFMLPDKLKTGDRGLSEDAMFDRIINLKFTIADAKGKSEDFIIRSDFEVALNRPMLETVFNPKFSPSDKNLYYSIHKCVYKPSITLRLNRPAPGISTSVTIKLDNFYLMTKDGKRLTNLTNAGTTIKNIKVMAGYFGQFNKMPHSNIWDLFNFQPRYGVSFFEIKEDLLYISVESTAPHNSVVISGYLGEQGFSIPRNDIGVDTEETVTYKDLQKNLIKFNPSAASSGLQGTTFIQKLFYENIVKPFEDKRKSLSAKQAEILPHVNIYFTKKLNTANEEAMTFLTDSEQKPAEVISSMLNGDEQSVSQVITKISERLATNFTVIYLNNGDIVIGLPEERNSIEEMAEDYNSMKIKEKLKKSGTAAPDNGKDYYKGCIPAVYSININATVDIVCPFYTFIDVFDTVKFKHRYNTSQLVKYYIYNGGSDTPDTFWIYTYKIAFATVEDVNETEMHCVSHTTAQTAAKEIINRSKNRGNE